MTPTFEIKDKFTLPPPVRADRPTMYPFADLNIGQTAIFSLKGKRDKVRIRAAISKLSGDRGLRFATRTLPDGKFAVQRVRAARSV